MKLTQNVTAVETVKDLRHQAKRLREDGVLYYQAELMDRAADIISEYVRKEVERG